MSQIYRRLEVVEVWFWENNRLKLYHKRENIPSKFLETKGYKLVDASELLPELNISLLEECTLISDDILAIDEFEQLNMLGFLPQPNLQKSYIPPFPHREGG